jgi:hypothetical protein
MMCALCRRRYIGTADARVLLRASRTAARTAAVGGRRCRLRIRRWRRSARARPAAHHARGDRGAATCVSPERRRRPAGSQGSDFRGLPPLACPAWHRKGVKASGDARYEMRADHRGRDSPPPAPGPAGRRVAAPGRRARRGHQGPRRDDRRPSAPQHRQARALLSTAKAEWPREVARRVGVPLVDADQPELRKLVGAEDFVGTDASGPHPRVGWPNDGTGRLQLSPRSTQPLSSSGGAVGALRSTTSRRPAPLSWVVTAGGSASGTLASRRRGTSQKVW